MDLAAARETQRQVVARELETDRVIGAALVEMVGASVELTAHPDHRRGGVGSWLLAAARAVLARKEIAVWAHGDLPAASAFAAARGGSAVGIPLSLACSP